MSRERLIYQERYKKGSTMISPDYLPTMNNVPEDMEVESAEIKESGIIDRGGVRQEYQVIRVIFRPTHNGDESDG